MKVGRINQIPFRSQIDNKQKQDSILNNANNTTLPVSCPDYNIKTPLKYTKLGVAALPNGTEIHSYKLSNGHRVTIVPMGGSPAVVKNYVNVGSLNETDDIKGISHFLEHMAFNGSVGNDGFIKLNQGDSFKKIENLGGWTNASTNYALTDYVNSTPLFSNDDLKTQIEVIAAMNEDLALTDEMIEKEKGPVCSEINMILDDPQTIAVDQTVRTLFNIKSSADELVGGSVNHIKNLTREKIKAYYDKYYVPENMNLVITGDINPDETIEIVSKAFGGKQKKSVQHYEEKLTPINKTIRKDYISDKAQSTQIVLGFSGPKNNDTKSKIIFDIIQKYIKSTDAGIDKVLKNINSNGGYLSMDKISTNPYSPTLILYSLNCADENSEKALKILFDKLNNLKFTGNLENIKDGLKQDYDISLEYAENVNQMLGTSIFDNGIESVINYEKILDSITTEDINNSIAQYLNIDKAAVTVVHPNVEIDKINQNYNEASKISFKGKREPVNIQNTEVITLNNNYKCGFTETKSNNVYVNIELLFPPMKDIKPGVAELLEEIYEMGSLKLSRDNFNKFKDENNIDIQSDVNKASLKLSMLAGSNKFQKSIEQIQDMIKNPAINEENLKRAKDKIRDKYSRIPDTSLSLFIDSEAEINPLYTKKEDILNNLENITIDDINNYHKYILANSSGIISMNIPENNRQIKEIAKREFENLQVIKPYAYKLLDIHTPNTKPAVIMKNRNVSQADIMETFKFKCDDSSYDSALCGIINNLLSSSSIGLFNTLREKEHLAYSVHPSYSKIGNNGEFSLNILTTTDDKDLGEISYDNIEKSINGFNRQVACLLNSEYTDEDLESAKKILKANLLNNEGIIRKVNIISNSLDSEEGIEYYNNVYKCIDKISREDIDNFAHRIFTNPPIYTIVASKDSLEANKEFLDKLSKV